jgi:hypothetical protein
LQLTLQHINAQIESYGCRPVTIMSLLLPSLRVCIASEPFLGAFAKATMSFVMSGCLSVCPSVRMEQLDSHRKDFLEILYLDIVFENLSRKFKFD